MLGRSPFAKLVRSQLDVFVQDHRVLLDEAAQRLTAYNRAERSDAEELYGDYVDSTDAVADALAEMRDHYARTLDDPDAYVEAFNRAARRRLPGVADDLENH